MNKLDLLKKFLPGFIPLIVFIVADEIWGTTIGLIVAVAFGIGQFLFTYIKEKVVDKFVLFDTLLIVVLGLISFLLDNDIFFKMKPAFIGLIMCIILGLSAFSPMNIMGKMTQRYMKDMSVNETQMKQFNRSIKILFFIFTLHTLLVFYSAFYMSKEAWAFISTGLFYIIFGVYFVYEFAYQKIKNKKLMQTEEWLPVVDETGNVIGKATRTTCHQNKELLHPVVHLHVINTKKQIYLQKRPLSKLIQPGKWDTAVGGHISINEKIEDALKREAFEEIGIENFTPQLITKYKWVSDVESELVFMFGANDAKDIKINNNEVDDGRFWSIKEIKENLGKEIFTPNFEHEFAILVKILK